MARTRITASLTVGFCSAVAIASSAMVLATGSRGADPHEAAGVFPPWWSRSDVLRAAAAAGAVRDLGAAPFIVVVRDEDGHAVQRLRRAGALFSAAPAGSAACGF